VNGRIVPKVEVKEQILSGSFWPYPVAQAAPASVS